MVSTFQAIRSTPHMFGSKSEVFTHWSSARNEGKKTRQSNTP